MHIIIDVQPDFITVPEPGVTAIRDSHEPAMPSRHCTK